MVRAGGDSDAPSSTVSPPLQPPSLSAPPQHTVSPHDAAFAFSGTDMIGPITSLLKQVVPGINVDREDFNDMISGIADQIEACVR